MQRQQQTRYQSCLTLSISRATWNKWSTSPLWCLTLGVSACGNSEQTDTSDHLMAESGPCVGAEPGAGNKDISHMLFSQGCSSDPHHIMQKCNYSNCLVCCFWHWHCRLWISAIGDCCFPLLRSCEISELLNAIFQANYLPQIFFFFP